MEPSVVYDLVVTNGTCVTAADFAPFDIAIRNGKIALLAPSGSLKHASAVKVIDAEGGFITVSDSDVRRRVSAPNLTST